MADLRKQLNAIAERLDRLGGFDADESEDLEWAVKQLKTLSAQPAPAGEVAEPAVSCYHENNPACPLYDHAKLVAYGDARAAAAASRPATAVPEGWMSVQVVEDVRAVVDGAMTGYCPYHTSARSSMRRLAAMLSAAPQPATCKQSLQVPQPAAVKQDLTTAQGDADEMVCAACGGTGEVHADDGEGPWACYYGCQKPQPEAKAGASLLRKPGPLPDGCYCKPGQCAAPVVMGRQTACRDPQKAAAQLAPAEGGAVADILRDALNLRGVIADGDLVTLAERCRNRIIDDRDLLTAAANNDLEREAKPAAATRADVEALAVKIDGMLKKRADLFQIKNTMAYLQAFSGWDSSAGQFIADHGVAVSELLRRLSGAQ